MARNNAWANDRLLGACAALGAAAFAAPRTGFFPSLRETLNHVRAVDLYYLDALEEGRAWGSRRSSGRRRSPRPPRCGRRRRRRTRG
jgi:uncharacterized damage-inducible protein DinB